MDICFFTPIFPPKFSGATYQALTLAKELRSSGSRIIFITPSDDRTLKARDVYDGFPVYRVFIRDLDAIINGNTKAWEDVGLFLKLSAKVFRLRREFSILHLHFAGYPYNALGIVAKLLSKKAIAKVTMENEVNFNGIGHVSGRVSSFCAKRLERIIAISSDIKNLLIRVNNGLKVEYIPNCVDTCKYLPLGEEGKILLKKEMGIDEERDIISYVGGVTYRKGVDSLIKWWPSIVERFPDSLLLFVGPTGVEEGVMGDEFCYEEVLHTIREFRMEKNVMFTGRVNNVHQYLKISDLFVFPSTMEGMPNVVLEAMACGLPVVSHDVSGVSDIITNGVDGYICEQGDSDRFRSCVLELLEDRTKRSMFSQKARAKIMCNFSAQRIGELYKGLYSSL